MVTVYQKLLPNPKMPNDKARIYLTFKLKSNRLTTADMVQFPPVGLGIAEYTGRISDLKKMGFSIKNESLNNYLLTNEPDPTLDDLRVLYIASNALGYKDLLPRLIKKAELIKHAELIKASLF